MYKGTRFGSETRGSQKRELRRVDATNAGFDTRVQVITRGERGREHELRVALKQEEHRRGHGLRAASIQERADCVKELLRRGVKIRVSNQQRGREEGKGDFGVVVLR